MPIAAELNQFGRNDPPVGMFFYNRICDNLSAVKTFRQPETGGAGTRHSGTGNARLGFKKINDLLYFWKNFDGGGGEVISPCAEIVYAHNGAPAGLTALQTQSFEYS